MAKTAKRLYGPAALTVSAATYDTGNNYEWASSGYTTAGSSYNDYGSTGLARIFTSISNNSGYGHGTFSYRATNLQSTAHRKIFQGTAQFVNSSPVQIFMTGGISWNTTATAVTALRFIASSGNIASGTIRIYGIAKV